MPWNRFSEPTKLRDGKTGFAWFAFGEAPVSLFAGLWTPWHGTRRKDEGPLDHDVFAFVTMASNAGVKPIPQGTALAAQTEEGMVLQERIELSKSKQKQ